MTRMVAVCVCALLVGACDQAPNPDTVRSETADEFVARFNEELRDLDKFTATTNWVQATYINQDTSYLKAQQDQVYAQWQSKTVADSLKYAGQELSPATARALHRLRTMNSQPAPGDPVQRAALAEITTALAGMYNTGTYCPEDGSECRYLVELEDVFSNSRDYDELLAAWTGWRTVAPPMRDKYQRYVELINLGAAELGFADLGEMWRSGYDMSPANFADETTRLWNQVKPLYDQLHCHVRATLAEHYGEDKVPLDQPIPAHLLGNMWAQSWENIYDIVEPYAGVADLDVTSTLVERQFSPQDMVRSAESFYVSLGLDPLPPTFWERSQFSKPRDREARCHASAWGLDGGNDLRILMCIKQTYPELEVIYHELGHNYYQRAFKEKPPIFQDGAHSGFHEAIGDTIVLAMTPAYLKEVGLIDAVSRSKQAVINDQMKRALRGIAVLPWAKLVDEWRWHVFSGEITPANYNKAWWELRERYQGVAAPVARSESNFDPGAKYHVAANVSYTRYFLARIMQFQFYEALCEASGHQGPLYDCSFYGSKEAGARLNTMLEAGASEPWQDTLEKMTGSRDMDGTAIINYFQPLMGWLQEQNSSRQCGW